MKWYWIVLIVIIIVTGIVMYKQMVDISTMKSELEALPPFKGCSSCLIDELVKKYGYLEAKNIFNTKIATGNLGDTNTDFWKFYNDTFNSTCSCPGIKIPG